MEDRIRRQTIEIVGVGGHRRERPRIEDTLGGDDESVEDIGGEITVVDERNENLLKGFDEPLEHPASPRC